MPKNGPKGKDEQGQGKSKKKFPLGAETKKNEKSPAKVTHRKGGQKNEGPTSPQKKPGKKRKSQETSKKSRERVQ